MITRLAPGGSSRPAGLPLHGLLLLGCTLLFTLVLLTLGAPQAWAQSAGVVLRAPDGTPEAGAPFRISMDVSQSSGAVQLVNPELKTPPGFQVSGPQMGFSGGFGSMGIQVHWTLVAPKAGRYVIGPVTTVISGERVTSGTITVRVAPPGQGTSRGQPQGGRLGWGFPFGGDPFDAFPGMRSLFDDDDDWATRRQKLKEERRRLAMLGLPLCDGSFAFRSAPDPTAFVRATATPGRAVIGEQVRFVVIAYTKGAPLTDLQQSVPKYPDFVNYPLEEDLGAVLPCRLEVGEEIWSARKLTDAALFAVRTGQLQIDPVEVTFPTGRRQAPLMRKSHPLTVTIVEPPVEGRPPGYQLGDVGRFSLTATVEPRRVEAGGAVSVVAKLNGTGNLPLRLRTPQQHGVEWLEPTVTDEITPEAGALRGWRRFAYVVRFEKPGQVDLGEISLPFWDPVRKRYRLERARLGEVTVEPGQMPPASTSAEAAAGDRLAALAKPRRSLDPHVSSRPDLGDRLWIWVLMGLSPLGVVTTGGLVRLGREIRRRLALRRDDQQHRAARALRDAEAALREGNEAAATSATERAIFLGIEGATGLKARGILKSELEGRLRGVGLESGLAAQLVALLTDLDAARFKGDAGASARGLVSRGSDCLSRLRRIAPLSDAGGSDHS